MLPKKGDTVTTPNGNGIVVEFEDYSRIGARRYGIKLDTNPFWFPVAFYFGNELVFNGKKMDRYEITPEI